MTSKLAVTPSEVIAYEGQTAEVTCHWVFEQDISELNLANEDAVKIEKPKNITKISDSFDTYFVNVTFIIFDIQRRDNLQLVHCFQLGKLSTSAASIQVYGEWDRLFMH